MMSDAERFAVEHGYGARITAALVAFEAWLRGRHAGTRSAAGRPGRRTRRRGNPCGGTRTRGSVAATTRTGVPTNDGLPGRADHAQETPKVRLRMSSRFRLDTYTVK